VTDIFKGFGGIFGTFIKENFFTTGVLVTRHRVNPESDDQAFVIHRRHHQVTSSTNSEILYTLL
jgi:hypothetical protein